MSEPKLLSCPLCNETKWIEYHEPDILKGEIVCTMCGLSLQDPDAIQRWNTRSPAWIPVSKRLPEKDEYYIVAREIPFTNSYSVLCLNYYKENNTWHGNYGAVAGVTHWIPLPDPPEEKE